MRVDLHNHTFLCNHATGTPEEYIQQAIKSKINILGFSEHAPMSFDEMYRLRKDEVQKYIELIDEVKNSYQDKIEILTGFEVDFLPGYSDNSIFDLDVDYFIGSVHFLNIKNKPWGFDNPEYIGGYHNVDLDKLWQEYFSAMQEMVKTGKYHIVGHIDLMKIFQFMPQKKSVEELIEPLLKEIKTANMAIEINGAGLRKPVKEQYPSKNILKLIYDLNIPITFGSDAHSVNQVGEYLESLEILAKEIGFKKSAIFKQKQLELVDLK